VYVYNAVSRGVRAFEGTSLLDRLRVVTSTFASAGGGGGGGGGVAGGVAGDPSAEPLDEPSAEPFDLGLRLRLSLNDLNQLLSIYEVGHWGKQRSGTEIALGCVLDRK
jgi:hypothetical protein